MSMKIFAIDERVPLLLQESRTLRSNQLLLWLKSFRKDPNKKATFFLKVAVIQKDITILINQNQNNFALTTSASPSILHKKGSFQSLSY